MSVPKRFQPIRIRRQTRETDFCIVLEARCRPSEPVNLPNQLLAHLVDHFLKAAGVSLRDIGTTWPGSWHLDHVLCEDMGQLIGYGISALHDQLAERHGIAGRSSASGCPVPRPTPMYPTCAIEE